MEKTTPTLAPGAEPGAPDETTDLVRQYLAQISTTALLTADQEVELAKRIEAGVYADELLREAEADRRELPPEYERDLEAVARDGQHAKDHMVRANLRLVVAVAKRHSRRGLPFLDVIQDGNLGLIRAVEKFDYAKGYKFSTYATWWIRQAIERGLAQHARTVRLPVHLVEELSRLGRKERELQLALGREPTAEEAAEAAGMPTEKVTMLRHVGRDAISLDTPVGTEGDTVVGDLIEDAEVLQAPHVAEYHALVEQLRETIGTLDPREAMVLTLRYGLHDGRAHTRKEVAERVALTPERVRQLENRALARLRAPERRLPLREWAS
ncbi:sigma-70 family RNA polymerase sigma factor [Streptomyces sp. TRM49041]|uniref:sigma-70 family RNA polymerase sigma factor n=1 Tax=Streptomyces sp. TRM49041 TaxID=2603216 RepID=UPI0011EF380C|nr:sigma-70 family RNA polymerase sigma factor [Streptomyces sp. TRM49041]